MMTGRQILEIGDGAFVACRAIRAISSGVSGSYIDNEYVPKRKFFIYLGTESSEDAFAFEVLQNDAEAVYKGLKLMMEEIDQPLANKRYTVEDLLDMGQKRIAYEARRHAAIGGDAAGQEP